MTTLFNAAVTGDVSRSVTGSRITGASGDRIVGFTGEKVRGLLGVITALINAAIGSAFASGRQCTIIEGSFGSVLVTWDAVAGASYYRVYYGTERGIYDQAFGSGVNVGNVTSYSVSGLNVGATYYMTVTATNASGNESDWGNEVTKVAT